MVLDAYILVQTDVGKASAVACTVAALGGVVFAQDLTGPYDVIVRAQAPSEAELHAVVRSIGAVAGVTRTATCHVPVGAPAR